MRRALIASLAFHLGLTGLLVGLSRLGPELPAPETPVTVEIVADPAAQAPAPAPLPPRPPVAEAAPVPQRQAAAPPPPPPAPKAEPKPVEAKSVPPPPPPPARAAEAKPEPPPPPPPPPKQAEAPPKPEPPPSVERAEAKPPPPPKPQPRKPEPPPKPQPAEAPAKPKPAEQPRKEVAKAEPKPERPRTPPAAKSEASDFDALLRSVEAQTKRVQAPEKREGKGTSAEAGGSGQPGEAETAQVNPSALVAAISQQVAECWSIPIAAQGVSDLRAELEIALGPDGSVRTVVPTDEARIRSDPVFRAFAESAVRAVQRCSPLKLPPESYQVWRNVIFNFEPSLLAG